jgi:hypothetical protein
MGDPSFLMGGPDGIHAFPCTSSCNCGSARATTPFGECRGRPRNDRHQTKRNERAFRQLGAVLIEGRGAYAVRGRIRPACQRLGYEAMLPLAVDVPQRPTCERRCTA